MVELKVYLPEGLNSRFRRIAMAAFGYGRGSLSKAVEEALTKWCEEHDGPKPTSQLSETNLGPIIQNTKGINPDERSHEEKRASERESDSSSSGREK